MHPIAHDFDLEGLLKKSLDLEDASAIDPVLFSLSPFSSPEVMPCQSPLLSVTSTPAQSPKIVPPSLPVDELTPAVQTVSVAAPVAKELQLRKARKKKQSHTNRRGCREEKKLGTFATVDTRKAIIDKYVKDAVPIPSQMDALKANVTQTAYVVVHDQVCSRRVYGLKELVGGGSQFGLKLVEWDGR